MEHNVRILKTDEEIKIVTDPYRSRIIDVFRQAGIPLTVKGAADIMGEVPAKVHYHVKKLLSIDILGLDHVEVINGINAKYYKILHTRYKIELIHDITKHSASEHLQKTINYLFDQVDHFKDDVLKLTEIEDITESEKEDFGLLSRGYLHLTESEYKDVAEYLMGIQEKYSKKDETKQTYSFVGGFIKLMDSNKK